MSARKYSSVVPAKTLSSAVAIGDTTISLSDGTNLPTAPYTLVIDPDTVNEEIVTVVSGSYTSLTVTRGTTGGDGTSAVAHASGATVRHMLTARDVKEAQDHIEASAAYSINNPGDDSGTTSATIMHAVHGIGATEGSVVGTLKAQELKSKTISLTHNTITGTKAEFNTALSDANFATTEGTETLTNKTLTSPTLSSPTLSGTVTIGSTALTATADELNILDGATVTASELNALDGLTASTAELNVLDGITASTGELNILDGVTASATEINVLDGITSSTAELNILDGVTSTAAELNLLDGVTATTAELNLTDGLGDAWNTSWTPTLSNGWTNGSTGVWVAAYKQIGKTVHVRAKFTVGDGSKGSTLTVSLPVNAATDAVTVSSTGLGFCVAGGVNTHLLYGWITATNAMTLYAMNTAGTYAARTNITSSIPATWQVGDTIHFSLTYEAA